ncbi:MAG: hypothetical protein DME45_06055 [Verrucomicrobia bacterium]|nr:MAG: hypothetical protein DME45_06055 [Verrucomicrobiota bacterium]PYK73714.1 MAG: hypothetical protein DME42_06325 [Verrucomicrobiota bacterium]
MILNLGVNLITVMLVPRFSGDNGIIDQKVTFLLPFKRKLPCQAKDDARGNFLIGKWPEFFRDRDSMPAEIIRRSHRLD